MIGGRRCNSSRGAIMVLAPVIIAVLIAVLGLAIDVARLLAVLRSAQNAADAAALAGTNELRMVSLNSMNRWKNIKKVVLAAASAADIRGLNVTAARSLAVDTGPLSFRYTAGSYSPTPHDAAGYDFNSGVYGNLRISTIRGLFCYEPAGATFVRRWYSLERPDRYCYADSVRVQIEVRDISLTFARIFGVATIPQIQVDATANLNQPNSCGSPRCSDLGVPEATGDEFATFFAPSGGC